MTWNGPDPGLRRGPSKDVAKGPVRNQRVLQDRNESAKGPNPSIRKGPKHGLAKGSMYAELENEENISRKR